jgi:hypothetical protein
MNENKFRYKNIGLVNKKIEKLFLKQIKGISSSPQHQQHTSNDDKAATQEQEPRMA